ncbi:MAG: SDR family oxidoreductase [Actinomycetota bacterium]
MSRLEGKVALVTGAARGTGAEIANLFVEEGARVVSTDILDDRGSEHAAAIGARFVHLDVTSETNWSAVIDNVRRTEGRLDVLVNNAAVLHLTSIDNTTVEIFEQVFRVNCLGAFLGVRAALPLMRESGGGSVVNIGSIDSVLGVPATVAYTSSKFALRGLTKVAALENGKFGIRCNIVCPAAGSAEMYGSLVGPPLEIPTEGAQRRGATPRLPLGRSRGPIDVAGAALFFASDDSRFCTGVELVIDGGMTAGEYVSVPGQFDTQ